MKEGTTNYFNEKGQCVAEHTIGLPDDADFGQVTVRTVRKTESGEVSGVRQPMLPPPTNALASELARMFEESTPTQLEAMAWLAEQGEDPISQRYLVQEVDALAKEFEFQSGCRANVVASLGSSLRWRTRQLINGWGDKDPTDPSTPCELENHRPLGGLTNAETNLLLSGIREAISALRSPTAAWPDDARRIASELERLVK